MPDNITERRACERFGIPGAVVYCKKESFFSRVDFGEDSYPVFDISRGGLRFLTQKVLPIGARVILKIVQHGEGDLIMTGTVKWTSPHPGRSYKYEIGVQFDPYGGQKMNNPPEALKKIMEWEKKARGTDPE